MTITSRTLSILITAAGMSIISACGGTNGGYTTTITCADTDSPYGLCATTTVEYSSSPTTDFLITHASLICEGLGRIYGLGIRASSTFRCPTDLSSDFTVFGTCDVTFTSNEPTDVFYKLTNGSATITITDERPGLTADEAALECNVAATSGADVIAILSTTWHPAN